MRDPFSAFAGAYVLGSLRGSEREAFEAHLARCPACALAVSELAHLPGLLDLIPAEGAADPPPTVLEGLLAVVRRDRARRRTWLAGIAAAVAVGVAVGVAASGPVRGLFPEQAMVSEGTSIELLPVSDVPVTASVELVSVPWGTRLGVTCSYAGGPYAEPVEYALILHDAAGRTEQVATWTALPGAEATVSAATAMRLDQITRVEMTSAGAVILIWRA